MKTLSIYQPHNIPALQRSWGGVDFRSNDTIVGNKDKDITINGFVRDIIVTTNS